MTDPAGTLVNMVNKFPVSIDAATKVLQRYWGHSEFRPGQWELIDAVLSGRDAFGVLPTGAGKSVCYQLPAVMLPGLTIVISPLIALMEDQVLSLNKRGIPAATLSGGDRHRPWEAVLNDARYGRYKILFVSPERLQSEAFKSQYYSLDVSLVAVDEAHCISEWGHEFRPEYYQIAELYAAGDGEANNSPTGREWSRVPVIAVTATATPVVRTDIKNRLRLRSLVEVTKSFDRPNLSFSVFNGTPKHAKVEEILRSVPGSGIIYASTRRSVEAWGRNLTATGHVTEIYHAGLSAEKRSEAQLNWISGNSRIIVATNAFGMGVDKSNVRSVIHVGLPMSMEAYYQEAGRAGRDGRKAYAAMVVNKKDIADRQSMLSDMYPTLSHIRTVFDALHSVNGVAIGDISEKILEAKLDVLARATGLESRKISIVLNFLVRAQFLDSASMREDAGYKMKESRPGKLSIDGKQHRRQKNGAIGRLRDVLSYVNERDCRRRRIVAHFDDYSIGNCGMCDNCLGRHKAISVDPRLNGIMLTILNNLALNRTIYGPEDAPEFPRYRIDEMTDWLAINGYVQPSDDPNVPPLLTDLGASVAAR